MDIFRRFVWRICCRVFAMGDIYQSGVVAGKTGGRRDGGVAEAPLIVA